MNAPRTPRILRRRAPLDRPPGPSRAVRVLEGIDACVMMLFREIGRSIVEGLAAYATSMHHIEPTGHSQPTGHSHPAGRIEPPGRLPPEPRPSEAPGPYTSLDELIAALSQIEPSSSQPMPSESRRMRGPALGVGILAAALSAGAAVPRAAAAVAKVPRAIALTGNGSQVYACQRTDTGYSWVLQGPEATLVDDQGRTVLHHFAGPTWEASDGSRVEGRQLLATPAPPGTVGIPWLVLRAHVLRAGWFDGVEFITRTKTQGGGIPDTPCGPQQVGHTAREAYSASYTFFFGGDPDRGPQQGPLVATGELADGDKDAR